MRPRFDFTTITRIEQEEWADKSLLHNDYRPGTILLLGPWGACAGFIKLTGRGQFMLLTKEQVFTRDVIRWPHSSVTFVIEGDRAVFDMGEVKKEGSPPPRPVTPRG